MNLPPLSVVDELPEQGALWLRGGRTVIEADGRRVEVNEHDVVVEGAERFVLPYPKKGWQGCPLAAIKVAPIAPGRWIWATEYQLSQQGAASPLSLTFGRYRHPEESREAAIAAAVASLRVQMESARDHHRDPLIRTLLAWLDRGVE